MSYMRGRGIERYEAEAKCGIDGCEGTARGEVVIDHSVGATDIEGDTHCDICGADLIDNEWEPV